jgi:hypothetical protein
MLPRKNIEVVVVEEQVQEWCYDQPFYEEKSLTSPEKACFLHKIQRSPWENNNSYGTN